MRHDAISFSEDTHLADLFREAERKRDYNRINWPAVAAILTLVLVDGVLLVSCILAWRHWR